MIAGAKLFGYKGKILGVSIDESKNGLKKNVRALANETIRYLGEETNITTDEVLVNGDYLGQGYGIMGALEREAILLFAQYEGLLLDPVYTGRAAAGLIDLIRKGFFSAQERILFLHTGGTPALFAENYKDLI